MPYLTKEYTIGDGHFNYTVINSGVGPGKINLYELSFGDKKYINSDVLPKILHELFSEFGKFDFSGTSFGSEVMMPANKSEVLMDVRFAGQTKPSAETIASKLKKLKLVINYDSIYQEKRHY